MVACGHNPSNQEAEAWQCKRSAWAAEGYLPRKAANDWEWSSVPEH